MIAVEGLRYRYPPIEPGQPWSVALDDVSFEVPAGSCLAVTGPNNCGKTTLCLALAGLAPRLTAGHLTGRIDVAGHDPQAEPLGSLAGVVGLVMQDATGQLFSRTIEAEVAWGLENLGLPLPVIQERIAWALSAVGLSDVPRQRPSASLSGGQQKRLALAAALALEPRVLILDEPTGGIAPAARDDLVALLQDLRSAQDLTILLTETDPAAIAALADRLIVLDGGQIVRNDEPCVVYASLVDQPVAGVSLPPAARFMASLLPELPLLLPLTLDEVLPHLNGTRPAPDVSPPPQNPLEKSRPAIQLDDLHFAYDEDQPVLHDLNVTISSGQFVVLAGDNGAGKTTLARHLVGLLRSDRGSVRLFGEDTREWSIGRMARQVGLAFQSPEIQIFSPTVREEVSFGPRNFGLSGDDLKRAVAESLERFGLSHLADYPPAALSFSDRRLIALASIAAMRSPIIVLDEPTVGLDAIGQGRVLAWLNERHQEGATVILITHDMELAAGCAERVLVMRKGQIVADGPPHTVFREATVMQQAGLKLPFAAELAAALKTPLPADLTAEGAAQALQKVTS